MENSPETNKGVAEFWSWFEKNFDRLLDFEDKMEEIFEELKIELRKIHPDLVFEFGPKTDAGWEFSISADGILEVFPYVRAIVDMAPKFDNLRIHAFRQRCDTNVVLTINDISLKTEDVKFMLNPDVDMVGITIYFPDAIDVESDAAKTICCLLLDNALGEFDAVTKISYLEIKNYDCSLMHDDIHSWLILPQTFDDFYSQLIESGKN